MTEITRLLARWNSGDREAFAELMPLVYEELRRLADHFMANGRDGHTLQPTALVHETYLKLARVREGQFKNRVHFYGAAAQAMRRILVDHARQRLAQKRGEAIYQVAGGYLAAWVARERARAAVAILAVVGVVLSAAGVAATWNAGPQFGPKWYGSALVILAAPTVWVGGSLYWRTMRREGGPVAARVR